MGDLHINTGGPSIPLRGIQKCPTCQQRRRMTGAFQLYYSVIWTCCTCGDGFADGQRLPRRWSVKDAAKAQARWSTSRTWDNSIGDIWALMGQGGSDV